MSNKINNKLKTLTLVLGINFLTACNSSVKGDELNLENSLQTLEQIKFSEKKVFKKPLFEGVLLVNFIKYQASFKELNEESRFYEVFIFERLIRESPAEVIIPKSYISKISIEDSLYSFGYKDLKPVGTLGCEDNFLIQKVKFEKTDNKKKIIGKNEYNICDESSSELFENAYNRLIDLRYKDPSGI